MGIFDRNNEDTGSTAGPENTVQPSTTGAGIAEQVEATPVEAETETKPEQTEDLALVLQKMREMQEELSRLKSDRQDEDDNISDSNERKAPEFLRLATIGGMPIIDMRLEQNNQVDHNGNLQIKSFKAICKVFGTKEDVEITYGVEGNPSDYTNIPRKKFRLTNQDMNDLTGASKVLKGQIQDKQGVVPEIDRSGDSPRRTGKNVQLITRRDIRYYTIIANEETGETCELHQDKIYP